MDYLHFQALKVMFINKSCNSHNWGTFNANPAKKVESKQSSNRLQIEHEWTFKERLTLHSSSERTSIKEDTTSAAAIACSFTNFPKLCAEAARTSSSSSSKASFNAAALEDATEPKFPKPSAAPQRTPPSSSVKSLRSVATEVSLPKCPSARAAAHRTSSSSSSVHRSNAGTAVPSPAAWRPRRPKASAAVQRSRARPLWSFSTWKIGEKPKVHWNLVGHSHLIHLKDSYQWRNGGMNFPIKTFLLQLLWQPTQVGTSCAIWFEALLSVGPSTATIGPTGATQKVGGLERHLTSPLGQTEPKRTLAREANAEVITKSSCRDGGVSSNSLVQLWNWLSPQQVVNPRSATFDNLERSRFMKSNLGQWSILVLNHVDTLAKAPFIACSLPLFSTIIYGKGHTSLSHTLAVPCSNPI